MTIVRNCVLGPRWGGPVHWHLDLTAVSDRFEDQEQEADEPAPRLEAGRQQLDHAPDVGGLSVCLQKLRWEAGFRWEEHQ